MHAAEQVIWREIDVEPRPDVAVAAALASAQVDTAVVVSARFVIDDRAGKQIVAHHVGLAHALGGTVEQGGVGRRDNNPHVVRQA